MENFNLGDFLFSENGFIQGFAHFTENIYNFLFTEIQIFGNTLSVWQLFATVGISLFVIILTVKLIIS